MDRRIWQHYDLFLLGALLLLLVYGVAVIYSASHTIEKVRDSALRQAVFGLIGLLFAVDADTVWIAFAVVVEHGGHGGTTAAPIATGRLSPIRNHVIITAGIVPNVPDVSGA